MKTTGLYLAYILFFLGAACKSSQELHTMQFDSTQEMKEFFDTRTNPQKLVSAHRGGSYAFYPENCIETFEYVLQFTPALLEVDVEMSHDSMLVLHHDDTLGRTTTGMGSVRDKMWWELKKTNLKDKNGVVTPYTVTKLKKALKWARRNTILTLDVKEGVPLERVIDAVDKKNAEAAVVIIVYNVEDAMEVYSLNPNLMISLSLLDEEDIEELEASGIPPENIIAFTGLEPQPASFYHKLHKEGIPVISATFNTVDMMEGNDEKMEYYRALWKLGVDIIATDLPVEAGTYLLQHPELMKEPPAAIQNLKP